MKKMMDEAKSKIGQKFEVPYIEGDFIKKSVFTLKDVRDVDNRILCYFEESPLICNYTIIKEATNGQETST